MPIFNLPVEWVETISEDIAPENCDFEPDLLREWLRNNRDLTLYRVGDRVHTRNHVVRGYPSDYELVCFPCEFVREGASSRHPMRRELRISVPAPTKLPLP